MTPAPQRYLYVGVDRASTGELVGVDLSQVEERDRVDFEVPPLTRDDTVSATVGAHSGDGVVMEMREGWFGPRSMAIVAAVLRSRRPLWLHWPLERAVEAAPAGRLATHARHSAAVWSTKAARRGKRTGARLIRRATAPFAPDHVPDGPGLPFAHKVARRAEKMLGVEMWGSVDWQRASLVAVDSLREIDALTQRARPVALRLTDDGRVDGPGAYLRTDFWAPIKTGGSYGHTCYVAKELAARSDGFTCFMANRFTMLDELGLDQVLLPTQISTGTDLDQLRANASFRRFLRPEMGSLGLRYVYERLCLGNYVGAALSQALGVPYIVEYNGSEISMMRSFAGSDYPLAEVFSAAEMLAFRQATAISVVSLHIRNDLVARGVDPDRVIVNPNGVDPDDYRPLDPAARGAARRRLGWTGDEVVVGFVGTFGGWHGIDVLAEALPRVCAGSPAVRFLLVGDGHEHRLVRDAVATHGLDDRVHMTGMVAHRETPELLGACDILVSPHSAHMVDSPFFGSPTKLFEYMASGGAIVASDLEQIGEVLRPAIGPGDADADAGPARAVLVRPGDVDDLVAGVLALAARPDLRAALGANARRAAVEHFTWGTHVARTLAFAATRPGEPAREPVPRGSAAAPDGYKDATRAQWDRDPAGSHYVRGADSHTLDWYLEVERHRYEEYAPWMRDVMEFGSFAGMRVLEIGGGLGTDLAQFAQAGAEVTDLDLSEGHLSHARENFALRGLSGEFVAGDAEELPFPDDTFDLVYSNGVLHHTPGTRKAVREIRRVLRPGGRVIAMVYAENSLHYWRRLFWDLGMKERQIDGASMAEIMSASVELSDNEGRPLVKVYTRRGMRRMFSSFEDVRVLQRQLTAPEVPPRLRRVPMGLLERTLGWNLIVKARKPGG